MFKLIGHVVVFAVGAGAGVWWGAHHPSEAQNLADNEQAKIQSAVAIARRDLMQQVVAEQSSDPTATGTTAAAATPAAANHLTKYQEMLKKATDEVKNTGSNLLTPTANNPQ